MELTKDNFNVYAAAHYDNPYCLTEDEFLADLRQLTTIRRSMSKLINGELFNLRLLINNVIIFYNVFEHHAATNMLRSKINSNQIPYFNAMLKFLSLPMIGPAEEYDEEFYKRIQGEFN